MALKKGTEMSLSLRCFWRRKVVCNSRAGWVQMGLGIALFSCCAAGGLPPQNSAQILDDKTWYLKDAEIVAMQKSGDPSAAAQAESAVHARELSAIQEFLASSGSLPDRRDALLRWTAHHNGSVAAVAAGELLRDGAWDKAGMISQRMAVWDLDAQLQFVQGLLSIEPRAELITLGRALAAQLPHWAGASDRAGSAAASVARLLARSPVQSDRDHLLQLAKLFPNEAIVWVGVSRGDIREIDPILALATTVYNDKRLPEGLRAAAGLVVGQTNREVYDQLVQWVVAYLDEFAGRESAKAIASARANPLDPQLRKMYQRLADNQPLLAVLRELPDDILRRHADSLAQYSYGTGGVCTAMILAKKVPDQLVQSWKDSGTPIPKELYSALFFATTIQPSLKTVVTELIPESQVAQLQRQAEISDRSLVGVCLNLTIWD